MNLSLRVISPDVVLAAENILDGVDHCLKSGPLPHLADQISGSGDFITGTHAEVLTFFL